MKAVQVLWLAMGLTVFVVACGGGGSTGTGADAEPEPEPEAEPEPDAGPDAGRARVAVAEELAAMTPLVGVCEQDSDCVVGHEPMCRGGCRPGPCGSIADGAKVGLNKSVAKRYLELRRLQELAQCENMICPACAMPPPLRGGFMGRQPSDPYYGAVCSESRCAVTKTVPGPLQQRLLTVGQTTAKSWRAAVVDSPRDLRKAIGRSPPVDFTKHRVLVIHSPGQRTTFNLTLREEVEEGRGWYQVHYEIVTTDAEAMARPRYLAVLVPKTAKRIRIIEHRFHQTGQGKRAQGTSAIYPEKLGQR